MRILHLIHSEGVYGAERVLLYLAREQQQFGHSPLVGSIRDPGTAQTAFEAQAVSWGLRVIPIRIAPRPSPGVIRSLLRTIHELNPDVVHSHGYKANILLGPLPRRARGPMLATLHGWTGGRRFSALWLYERLERVALRNVDAVVPVTRQMLQLPALRAIRPARIRVVENGIPPLAVRLADLPGGAAPLAPDLLEFMGRRPTLVAIGRLSAEKGFSLLLEAFARARAHGSKLHQLLIAGEGREHQALARQVTVLGLSDAVRLAGYVQGADQLLGRSCGFVMSSEREGMPLVLLEAMQWRVPVLAPAVGAIPDVLDGGRRGHLVAPRDVGALQEGLLALMSAGDDDRVKSAYAAVSRHFTSERMTKEYVAAYECIAQSSGINQNGVAQLPAIPP